MKYKFVIIQYTIKDNIFKCFNYTKICFFLRKLTNDNFINPTKSSKF